MKIGLLTYHIDTSPGATLQAYATGRALSELNQEVYLIDLSHEPCNNRHKVLLLLLKPFYALRDYRMKLFRSRFYPTFTKHYKKLQDLQNDPPNLDAYCVGSDQVWNPKIAGELLLGYFLDFGNSTVKKFSYASSMGCGKWPIYDQKTNDTIKSLITSFVGISVREKELQGELKRLFDINAQLVCDPALLHTDYSELSGIIKPLNEIACYVLQKSPEQIDAMRFVGDKMDLPMRMILSFKPYKGFKYTYYPDLPRWINYLAGSRFVITDSFHGVVICLLYRKPFVVLYKENGISSRISNLLNQVGLIDRLYFDMDTFKKSNVWNDEIDWNVVHEKLDQYRESSWNYLKRTINIIAENEDTYSN